MEENVMIVVGQRKISGPMQGLEIEFVHQVVQLYLVLGLKML